MSKLEEIKRIRRDTLQYVDEDGNVTNYPKYDEEALRLFDFGHVDWLIEQVEQNKRYKEDLKHLLENAEYCHSIGILMHPAGIVRQLQSLLERDSNE